MIVTACSVLTSILFCSLYIIFSIIANSRKTLINSLHLLIFLTALCLFRLIFSVELPFAYVIRDRLFLPWIIEAGRRTLVTVSGVELNMIKLLYTIWFFGSATLLIMLCFALISSRRKLLRLISVGNPLAESVMAKIVGETKRGQKYTLIISSAVNIPRSYGFITPVIAIPSGDFTEADYRHILGHEWTHYLCRHNWIKLGVYLIWALFWWNPLIYVLRHKLNQMLEVDCDRRMTSDVDDIDKISYLESTLKVLDYVQNKKISESIVSFGFIGPRDNNDIVERFHIVLADRNTAKRWKSLLIAAALVLTLLFSYGLVVQPYMLPPLESGAVFGISMENAYIFAGIDGKYSLYVDGDFVFEIDPETNLDDPGLAELSIEYEKEE